MKRAGASSRTLNVVPTTAHLVSMDTRKNATVYLPVARSEIRTTTRDQNGNSCTHSKSLEIELLFQVYDLLKSTHVSLKSFVVILYTEKCLFAASKNRLSFLIK